MSRDVRGFFSSVFLLFQTVGYAVGRHTLVSPCTDACRFVSSGRKLGEERQERETGRGSLRGPLRYFLRVADVVSVGGGDEADYDICTAGLCCGLVASCAYCGVLAVL